MTNLKTLETAISTVCSTEPTITPVDVINDLVSVVLETMTDKKVFESQLKNSTIFFNDDLFSARKLPLNNEQCIEKFQILIHLYMTAVINNPPFQDFLSPLVDSYSKVNLGQFLTPPKLAQQLIGFLGESTSRKIMGDPTGCGFGSLVLSNLAASKFNTNKIQTVVLVDVDLNFLRGAILQILVPAIVHKIPLNIEAYNADVITDYTKSKKFFMLQSLTEMEKIQLLSKMALDSIKF